jgi:alpha-beta hydrolase superfamily lysophospholipase
VTDTTDALDDQARELMASMGPRRRVRPRLAEPLRDAEDREVETPGGPVMAWRLGAGPAVLLVHGWEDDNALWGPLIDKLTALGRAVVVMDLPGHGFSGAEASGFEGAAAAVRAVGEAMGPVDAVVAHSFGCGVSVMAIRDGLPARRAVLIAGNLPRRQGWYERLIERGVPAAVVERAKALSPAPYDIEADLPAMTAEALYCHSLDDEQCPVEDVEAMAALWHGAKLALTDGLGHRLVAQDDAMLERVVAFVA